MWIQHRALAVLIIAMLFLAASCSMSSNTATVTINTGLHKQSAAQKISIIDRVLAFLSLSARAQADPAPEFFYSISMSITGPGMSPMQNIDIPMEIGSKTLEVPAGASRVFTVVAFYPNEGPPLRGYGGIKTVNLTPGDSVNLNINMGELPQLNSMYWISDVQRAENQEAIPFNAVNWSIEATPPISGFYVYRAQGDSQEPPTESFQKIMTIPGISVLFYEDYSIIPDNVYWYKISAYNEYGEGEQSYAIPDQMFIN